MPGGGLGLSGGGLGLSGGGLGLGGGGLGGGDGNSGGAGGGGLGFGGGGLGGGGGGLEPRVRIVQLDHSSAEFRELERRFRSFWPESAQAGIVVKSIEAVSNKDRDECFNLTEADHSKMWASLPKTQRPECNTVELVHGSAHDNLRGIVSNGFDLESTPAHGRLYGNGAYFT